MPTFEIKKHRCPRCGKDHDDSVRSNFPDKPCGDCTKLIIKINQMERQLLAEEFSLEKKDEEIARQIDLQASQETRVLARRNIERSTRAMTAALVERLIKDAKRRKSIVEQILKLQREKR